MMLFSGSFPVFWVAYMTLHKYSACCTEAIGYKNPQWKAFTHFASRGSLQNGVSWLQYPLFWLLISVNIQKYVLKFKFWGIFLCIKILVRVHTEVRVEVPRFAYFNYFKSKALMLLVFESSFFFSLCLFTVYIHNNICH